MSGDSDAGSSGDQEDAEGEGRVLGGEEEGAEGDRVELGL
jgi:hypothetical protein